MVNSMAIGFDDIAIAVGLAQAAAAVNSGTRNDTQNQATASAASAEAARIAALQASQQASDILAAIGLVNDELVVIATAAGTNTYNIIQAVNGTDRRSDRQAINISRYSLDQAGIDAWNSDIAAGILTDNGMLGILYDPDFRGAENEVFPTWVLNPSFFCVRTPGHEVINSQVILDAINGLYLG